MPPFNDRQPDSTFPIHPRVDRDPLRAAGDQPTEATRSGFFFGPYRVSNPGNQGEWLVTRGIPPAATSNGSQSGHSKRPDTAPFSDTVRVVALESCQNRMQEG